MTTSPAKFLYDLTNERAGQDNVLPLLAVSIYRGVVPRSELKDAEQRAVDLSNYKLCSPGDIVINRMSAYQGAVGISHHVGVVSPEYLVLRARSHVEPRFLAYLIKSTWFVGQMTARVRGIGSATQGNVRTPRINPGDLGSIPVTLPSTEEQSTIADYLDAETARIDALIAKKRQMITMLKERHRAVIDWSFLSNDLRSYQLKHLLAQTPCYGVLVPRFIDEGVPFIRINDLPTIAIGGLPEKRIEPTQSEEYRRTRVGPGDVLLSVVGSVDKVAVVTEINAGSNTARAVARLVPKQGVPSQLLALWLQTTSYLDLAHLETGGDTAQPTLNMGDLAHFPCRFPKPGTRDRFLAELNTRLKPIQEANLLLASQIDLFGEHRRTLITAAVTGDLEVPGVAA